MKRLAVLYVFFHCARCGERAFLALFGLEFSSKVPERVVCAHCGWATMYVEGMVCVVEKF